MKNNMILNSSLIKGAKLASDIASDPDKLDFVSFLIGTIIVGAIIAVIGTCIGKYAFELDKENSISVFWILLCIIVLVGIIGYFIV